MKKGIGVFRKIKQEYKESTTERNKESISEKCYSAHQTVQDSIFFKSIR